MQLFETQLKCITCISTNFRSNLKCGRKIRMQHKPESIQDLLIWQGYIFGVLKHFANELFYKI